MEYEPCHFLSKTINLRRRRMKTKFLLVAGGILLAFLLAGCTVEYDTTIKSDQSGTVTEAIGLTSDELGYLNTESSGLNSSGTSGTTTPGNACDKMFSNSSSSLPSGTTTREEQKGDTTWCYLDTKFANLDELKSFYGDQNVTVNRLEVVNNTLYYDVSLDSSDESGLSGTAIQMTWKVTMPGTVGSNNADSKSGKTLTWDMSNSTGSLDMQAQSTLSSTTDIIWWLVGGLLCLCLIVVVIVIVVVVVVVQRNKKKKAAAPVETS
jgi:hypothetical protein